MIIRSKTFKRWCFANFDKKTLKDITCHGSSAGWPSISYCRDIRKIYSKFKEEIWEMLAEDSESNGYSNPLKLIADFNGIKDIASCDQFETLMVWHAVEKVAYQTVK